MGVYGKRELGEGEYGGSGNNVDGVGWGGFFDGRLGNTNQFYINKTHRLWLKNPGRADEVRLCVTGLGSCWLGETTSCGSNTWSFVMHDGPLSCTSDIDARIDCNRISASWRYANFDDLCARRFSVRCERHPGEDNCPINVYRGGTSWAVCRWGVSNCLCMLGGGVYTYREAFDGGEYTRCMRFDLEE